MNNELNNKLNKIILNPGEEVKYEIYMKMVETGEHTVSILSTYTAYRKEIKIKNSIESGTNSTYSTNSTYDGPSYGGIGQCFGPGQKCRTSILSFEVRTNIPYKLILNLIFNFHHQF